MIPLLVLRVMVHGASFSTVMWYLQMYHVITLILWSWHWPLASAMEYSLTRNNRVPNGVIVPYIQQFQNWEKPAGFLHTVEAKTLASSLVNRLPFQVKAGSTMPLLGQSLFCRKFTIKNCTVYSHKCLQLQTEFPIIESFQSVSLDVRFQHRRDYFRW